jgi:elongator complex protein 3
LCRLRINSDKSAFIRELHVYGKSLEIGKKESSLENRRLSGQHAGLGRKLMKEAEKIARKEKIKKLSVISGVGVREYYRKLGYNLENEYMVRCF